MKSWNAAGTSSWRFRRIVAKGLELARTAKVIGGANEARLVLYADQAKRDVLEAFAPDLRLLFIRFPGGSEALGRGGADPLQRTGLGGGCVPAEGEKCQRCWKYFAELSFGSGSIPASAALPRGGPRLTGCMLTPIRREIRMGVLHTLRAKGWMKWERGFSPGLIQTLLTRFGAPGLALEKASIAEYIELYRKPRRLL